MLQGEPDDDDDVVHGGPAVLIRPDSCRPPNQKALIKCSCVTQYVEAYGSLPFKVEINESTGRRAVATETIEAGTFLFAELPVIKAYSSYDDHSMMTLVL